MTTKSVNARRAESIKPKSLSEVQPDARRSEIAKRASLVSADNRTTKAQTALENAMLAIESQLVDAEAFENRFPGGLTVKAVAILARVNPRSLYTPKLKPLGEKVRTFVDRMNGICTAGSEDSDAKGADASKRRSLAIRFADLKRRWNTVVQDVRDTKLALQDTRAKYEKLLAENVQLKQANSALEVRVEAFAKRERTVVNLTKRRH